MRYISTDLNHRLLFGSLAPSESMSKYLAEVRYGKKDVFTYPENEVGKREWFNITGNISARSV